ncbi:hypothetical protein [Profundibacterium mesophilum]|uniref:Uncharacterized protein n=1 Tax=Profundibacterium mesophilum KAUST100406-0324 TaxID=1037889 RepID=A0A921TCN6_9RHOB|nr:hypothetical protein [Profundibacterium mesophilum]KAF0675883.1 hypothetical protein PMES_01773 [Profundibacterium mesophilum KAUST100406-0324]
MSGWRVTQLTFGSDAGRFHAHSYYDIPVMNPEGSMLVGFETRFTGRHPEPGDAVGIGIVETDRPGSWREIGTSTAWSWQQGPMAQFVPGAREIAWNERGADGFAARLHDIASGTSRSLSRPLYAIAPDGRSGLSVNMTRLDTLRPGYGYAALPEAGAEAVRARLPEDDGVWRVPLDGAATELLLPLARAAEFLMSQLPLRERLRHRMARYHYWFNHVKIAPGGTRFTVKLRWRRLSGGWNGTQGVSLTCGMDGRDLRLLAAATSHVLWLDDRRLYFYDERRRDMPIFEDRAPRGHRVGQLGAGVITANVHLRHLPPGPPPPGKLPPRILFDTPYSEEVSLLEMGTEGGAVPLRIDSFSGHVPARGAFRCDLHPCPDASGQRIALSSMRDGGRQIYIAVREET